MRNHTTNYRSLFATTLVLGAVATVWGKDEKLAPEFLQNSVRGNVDVIVRYKSAPLEKQHAKVAKGGGALKSKFDLIQSGHYSVPAAMLEELANDPDVEFVSPDRTVRGTLDLSMAAVNAGAAQTYRLTGAGVGIAILDSGITPQSDLRNGTISQIVYSQDFTGLGSTDDRYGHGTHVAGIVAGNGSQSMGKSSTRTLVGMAPKANIVNLRVLDDQGQGKDSNVIAAINQAIALKKTYGIRVMNLSLGRAVQGSYTRDPLCQAVEAAWKAGIVVVVAAGNQGRNNSGGINGYGTITAPGNDPYVITVGAMKTVNTPGRSDDRIASYSSKGPTLYDHIVKPDIVAPGNQVRSLLNTSSSSNTSSLYNLYPVTQILKSYYLTGTSGSSSSYVNLSGTSMATPVVSGAAVLLLQQNPSLTPDQVKARLMKAAIGAGYLDVQAALANTDIATLPAISPAEVFNAATNTVSLVTGSTVVWGSNAVWGLNVVWGSSNTQGFNVVWGTGMNGAIDPASVVWGSSTVLDGTAVLIQGEN